MKSFINIFLTTLVVLLFIEHTTFAQSDTTKKRVVYWLHDDDIFWDSIPALGIVSGLNMQPYNTKFMQDFYIRGAIPYYKTDTGATGIGRRVREVVDQLQVSFLIDPTISQTPPIAIGHGVGGLVARSIEFESIINNKPQPFSGIITIGTPNIGSKLLPHIRNGDLQRLVTSTVADLFAYYDLYDDWKSGKESLSLMLRKSPLAPDPNDRPTPDDFKLDPTKGYVDTIPGFMRRVYGSLITSYVSAQSNHGILFNDISNNPESLFLTNINNLTVRQTIPVVSIISAGTQQPIYRYLASYIYPPWKSEVGKHDDTWLSNFVNKVASVYRGIGEILFTPTYFTAPFSPLLVDVSAGNMIVFEEFIKFAEALEKKFPDGVSTLIGSVVTRTEQLGYKVKRDKRIDLADIFGVGDGLPVYIFEIDEKTIVERIEGDDGSLSVSQQNNPKSPIEDNIVIPGTNNIGVMNNRNAQARIDNILQDPRFNLKKR